MNHKLSESVFELEDIVHAYEKIFTEFIRSGVYLPSDSIEQLKVHLKQLNMNKLFSPCPFPNSCSCYDECKEKKCNADECSNGYAYRRS